MKANGPDVLVRYHLKTKLFGVDVLIASGNYVSVKETEKIKNYKNVKIKITQFGV